MFKLAIISTLATSAVNALEAEADADTMDYQHPWADTQADFEGLFPRSIFFKPKDLAFRGNIGDLTFEPPRDRRSNSSGKSGSRVAQDKDRRPTLRGDTRARGGHDGSDHANTPSAKEEKLRQRHLR